MPVFSLRRRTQRAATSAKCTSSSPSSPPSGCVCELRPLRVFCIPCMFVVPPATCSCQCATALNLPRPESSAAASPLHVSASTTLTPAATAARNGEQPVMAHRRTPAAAAHNSSDVNALSTVAPSSFLHDLNANMTVVLNLTDSSHAISPTPSFSPEPQIHTGSALTAAHPNTTLNATRSEPAEPSSPRSYSSSESRDVLDDDSDITEETSYDSLVKQLQQTSPEAFSRALQAVKAPDLSTDSRAKLMAALENAMRTLCIEGDCISLPLSNVRIEAYSALASFYASTSSPEKDKVIDYCQLGLDLAAGRERLFPQLVAKLHALKARVLVSIGDLSRIQEAIAHAKAAQVALYAIRDPKLQYEVCVTLGDAYTVLMDGATGDNICQACEHYDSAIKLSKMAALESPIKVMWLSCRVALLTLRFLKQKRGSHSVKDNEPYGGRKGAAIPNSMSIPILLNMLEQLRIDVERLRESEVMVSEQVRQLESVVSECVGRAYFERARTSNSKVQDLKKAALSMQKALALCSWEADPSGRRYAGIQEMIDDVQSHLKVADGSSNQTKRR